MTQNQLPITSNSDTHNIRGKLASNIFNSKSIGEKFHQVPFATGNAFKPLDKTPFPQTIAQEEWETIIHPSVVMRPEEERDENHAADEDKYIMKVPKFWNPSTFKQDVRSFLGNNGERLITPEEASRIGSLTPPRTNYDVEVGDVKPDITWDDKTGNVKKVDYVVDNRPPDEIEMLETIFVTIASYRDYRCPHTVEALFEQAKYPERIRVGIVDQIDLEEDENCAKPKKDCGEDPDQTLCRYKHQIDVYEMDAQLAVGPVFARHIGDRMYRGEYFIMQCDAHMEFVNDWDVDVIGQWKSAENEMAILTTYVSEVDDHYDKKTGGRLTSSRPFMCQTDFEDDYYNEGLSFLMHGQQPEEKPSIVEEPLLLPFWAAGFSFARGHFGVQVPYDQYLPMIFQGEEINMGVRGFSYGYDFYAPEKSVLYHYYHTDKNHKKRKVKRFWEHSDNYKGVENQSKARLLGLIEMLGKSVPIKNEDEEADAEKEDGIESDPKIDGEGGNEEGEVQDTIIPWVTTDAEKYGLGKVRTVEKFCDTFGIDLLERKVQKHLCKFVGAAMTRIFTKQIRSDGMGIDYSKIDFQFKDPDENGNTTISWEKYYL